MSRIARCGHLPIGKPPKYRTPFNISLLPSKTKKAPEGAFCHFLLNDYSSAEKPAFSSAARLSVACSAEGPSCSSARFA
jgi:hypothetical protein